MIKFVYFSQTFPGVIMQIPLQIYNIHIYIHTYIQFNKNLHLKPKLYIHCKVQRNNQIKTTFVPNIVELTEDSLRQWMNRWNMLQTQVQITQNLY